MIQARVFIPRRQVVVMPTYVRTLSNLVLHVFFFGLICTLLKGTVQYVLSSFVSADKTSQC